MPNYCEVMISNHADIIEIVDKQNHPFDATYKLYDRLLLSNDKLKPASGSDNEDANYQSLMSIFANMFSKQIIPNQKPSRKSLLKLMQDKSNFFQKNNSIQQAMFNHPKLTTSKEFVQYLQRWLHKV